MEIKPNSHMHMHFTTSKQMQMHMGIHFDTDIQAKVGPTWHMGGTRMCDPCGSQVEDVWSILELI